MLSRRYFVGFLEGYFESLKIWWKERFLLAVESNLILYGFDGKKFFTRRFDSPEEFEKTRVALAKRLPRAGLLPAQRGLSDLRSNGSQNNFPILVRSIRSRISGPCRACSVEPPDSALEPAGPTTLLTSPAAARRRREE